jgi:NAD(P)-dependent dehydrogenase (short-subunit alcohol dehydrogenase family)
LSAATTERCADEGAKVVVADINESAAEECAACPRVTRPTAV